MVPVTAIMDAIYLPCSAHSAMTRTLSQSTISSLYSGSFGMKLYDVNIQQQTILEVANTDKVMADNKELDPPPPQDISNVFAVVDLVSCSSSDSDKYKCAWLKAKLICSYILSGG